MKEIRKIIAKYDEYTELPVSMALASVVSVEQSSYRRIGARMLVCSNGIWEGGISGGCLEGDALKRAQIAIFKNKCSIVTYDTLEDDENQIGVGLGCNGKIDILFEPIDISDASNIIEQLRTIANSQQPRVLLKKISPEYPEQLGNHCLVEESDINDIPVDFHRADLNTVIKDAFRKGRPQILKRDTAAIESDILVEYIRPETNLVIIGDNYDVNALIGIVNELGWNIFIVGRLKKMNKYMTEHAHGIFEYESLQELSSDRFTAFVLMTHDYNWDIKLIPEILKKEHFYFGMLGPRKRLQKIMGEDSLKSLQLDKKLHSPIGLDIGAETPEEIALAICSEIISVMRSRDAGFLKDREGSIH